MGLELPHLVAPPEGPVLELQNQEAILLYVHYLRIPAEPYLIDSFGSNGGANLVRTGVHLFELHPIRGNQRHEVIKIGQNMEDARGWSLDESVVFIYLSLIVEKLESLWNRRRNSTTSQN